MFIRVDGVASSVMVVVMCMYLLCVCVCVCVCVRYPGLCHFVPR